MLLTHRTGLTPESPMRGIPTQGETCVTQGLHFGCDQLVVHSALSMKMTEAAELCSQVLCSRGAGEGAVR